jgi:hypothetical protein
MEVRLIANPIELKGGFHIEDEHGWIWKISEPSTIDGTCSATSNGIDDRNIDGYFKEGILYIMYLDDAKCYFASVNEG